MRRCLLQVGGHGGDGGDLEGWESARAWVRRGGSGASCCQAPGGADLDEGVGMGLLALLLDSKTSKRGNINWCVSIFYPPAPKKLSGPLWGVPVEMLLEGKLARKVSDQFWFLRSP
jgi:hypothetical protein